MPSSVMIPITINIDGVDEVFVVRLSDVHKFNKVPKTDFIRDDGFYGSHKGIEFHIVKRSGYFCGYILIESVPQIQNIFSEMICDDDEFEEFINKNIYTYQGITYISADKSVIGFDCAHLDDIIVENKKIESLSYPSGATYKTYSFVRNQCVKAIDSLIEFWQKSIQDYVREMIQTQALTHTQTCV